jgi:uncharacterized protein
MAVFIDTSFLIGLVINNDQLHTLAVAWRRALRGPFVTSEFVLLEVADSLSNRPRRSFAQDIMQDVRDDPAVEVVSLDSTWMQRGWQLFVASADKAWSLTDCISFEIMRQRAITDALTHDHHFEQAGFHALLRHDPPSN